MSSYKLTEIVGGTGGTFGASGASDDVFNFEAEANNDRLFGSDNDGLIKDFVLIPEIK